MKEKPFSLRIHVPTSILKIWSIMMVENKSLLETETEMAFILKKS